MAIGFMTQPASFTYDHFPASALIPLIFPQYMIVEESEKWKEPTDHEP